jgi:hypothetical protein
VEIFQLPALRSFLHQLQYRTACQLSLESESESELLCDWRFTANQFVLATSPLRPTTRNFIFQVNICGYSPYLTCFLTRGWICRLQLLLVLDSAVILRSESRGIHDHISLSQIRDSPNLEGQVPLFISPRNRVARPSSLFASYDVKGLGGGIRPRLHTGSPSATRVTPLITFRREPHDSSIVACVFVVAETCLLSHCISQSLHSNS